MLYKIFLVEDQSTIRESMRESISWESAGFVFAGEAPDGEMALPLIEEIKPDILITDIMMPFMDGLELSRIVRKNMPWIKIIILSGHDEFNFAREAISIGITEYLLKPVDSMELINALKKAALLIENEKLEKENIESIHKRLKDSMQIMKEKFLINLISGVVPSAEAIEKSKLFNMNIISRYYTVTIITPQMKEKAATNREYEEYLKTECLIGDMVDSDPDIIKLSRNLREILLIFKGDNPEELEKNSLLKSEILKNKVEENSECFLTVYIGSVKERIHGISQSFRDAETLKKFSHMSDKNKIMHYNDMAKFIEELGEGIDTRKMKRYVDVIGKAKEFINENFSEPDISLNTVASSVNISPSHFSTIFSQETGETFIEYLTNTRIKKAMELLKTTNLKSSEIAFKVGYNDPHYFSHIFKKTTGITIRDFIQRERLKIIRS